MMGEVFFCGCRSFEVNSSAAVLQEFYIMPFLYFQKPTEEILLFRLREDSAAEDRWELAVGLRVVAKVPMLLERCIQVFVYIKINFLV
jgi:hypothetical protein